MRSAGIREHWLEVLSPIHRHEHDHVHRHLVLLPGGTS
jgi:hypothetical protein